MADRDRAQYSQLNPQQQRYDNVGAGGGQSVYPHVYPHQKGPSTGQVLAVVTLLPVGGVLLGLAGITLVGTLIGLAVATPLFVICSPVVVPAAIMLVGAVTGILTSGVFGLTGLSSLSWVVNSFRRCTGEDPLEYAKRRMHEATVQAGEKTKQMGEAVGEKTKQAGETVKTKSEGGGGGGTTGGRT